MNHELIMNHEGKNQLVPDKKKKHSDSEKELFARTSFSDFSADHLRFYPICLIVEGTQL